jgi:hypothetical protein
MSEAERSEAWRGFCHPGASWLQAGVIAVQAEMWPVPSPGAVAWTEALVQLRGAMTPKAVMTPSTEARLQPMRVSGLKAKLLYC